MGQSLDESDPLLRVIQVVDVNTGESTPLFQGQVLAFFWSPDGTRIAFVTGSNDGTAFPWRIADLSTGEDRSVADFHPSGDQLVLLSYFDQYALSHRVWSPDSRSLVFAGTLAEDGPSSQANGTPSQVFVVDAEGNSPPQAIAEGTMATWSNG